jgi:hypothetical protein
MEDTFKLITKYLKRKKWEYNGTQYIFRTAEPKDSYIECLIDCDLPKKGQSYTRLKFEDDLNTILWETHDMFGEKIAFNADFFVDGHVAQDVYLNDETKSRIRKELKSLYFFKINGRENQIDTKFSCELKIFPSFNKIPNMDNESITFSFFYDIFNLTYEDKSVKLKDSQYNEGKSWIEDIMLDNDFASDVADLFYTACEPDFKFKSSSDLYISASGYLRNIDGENKGDGKWHWWSKEQVDNFFEEI